MTLVGSLANAIALSFSFVLLAGAGKRIQCWLHLEFSSLLESLLFSLTLGTVLLGLFVSAGELAPNVRHGVIAAATLAALLGLTGSRAFLLDVRGLWQSLRSLPRTEQLLASVLLAVLALEGLAALAPLTGSDALPFY